MNPHPIATFARLAFARARRRRGPTVAAQAPSPDLRRQLCCTGACLHVPEEVWSALDAAHPDHPIEGPRHRQILAALFAPLMAAHGWQFCNCYRAGRAEHRFISRLVDTEAANAWAALIAAKGPQ